jgi:hypothetical protein
MNERRAIPFIIDRFEINDECTRIMFREGQDFGAKKRNDMVRNDFAGLACEISIVDA